MTLAEATTFLAGVYIPSATTRPIVTLKYPAALRLALDLAQLSPYASQDTVMDNMATGYVTLCGCQIKVGPK